LKAAAGPQPFPWGETMRLAFGLLRLSPRAFWTMTPIEFEHAIGAFAIQRPGPLRRDELAALMRTFPDHAGRETDLG
jgi:uncharacterized phage protein (TIGR02216 family)